jgi:hypothetical protein
MYNFIDKNILYKNRILICLVIFIIFLFFLHSIKPNFIYNNNGTFMEFGIGYTNKTIFPIWFIVIIFSLLIYIFVMYFINKMN